MTATIHHEVQTLLDDYLRLMNDALPGLLEGLYLHGSIALGAYIHGQSDIDAIMVIGRRCTESDIDALRTLHATLTERYPKLLLEGSYVQWHDLGQAAENIPPHPNVHDHILNPSGRFDINAVTWWVLKQHGIAVLGPESAQLAIEVDWDDLIDKMYDNMNSYWASFTTNPRRISWLLSDFGIEWTVLGVLRQFYSFREADITSKIGAGLYALYHLPPRWQRLIREAISIRSGSDAPPPRSRLVRALDAYAFLKYIIATSNAQRDNVQSR